MRAVITHEQYTPPGGSIVPDMALFPWSESRSSDTVLHSALDGSQFYVLRDFKPASGTMRLLFTDEVSAQSAYSTLSVTGTLRLENVPSGVDLPAPREFRFVVHSAGIAQDADAWVLDVEYTEITS